MFCGEHGTIDYCPECMAESEQEEFNKAISKAIHYPECWDTMAYPTLLDAIKEVGCNPGQCSQT